MMELQEDLQEDVKDTKLTKMLKMLKWIRIAPGINANILARLIGVSERGIYRYLHELQGVGIPIKSNHSPSGYVVEPFDIMRVIRVSEEEAPESDGEDAEVSEDVLAFLPDIPEHLPFTPGCVAVTVGRGSMAGVSYRYEGGDYSDPLHVEPMSTDQVSLAATGVKIEALDKDRGIGSVVIRWK